MTIRAAALALAAASVCALAPLRAQEAAESASPIRKRTTYDDLQLFGQVLNQIRVNHPDSIDSHDLFLALGQTRPKDPSQFFVQDRGDRSMAPGFIRRGCRFGAMEH